jgi:two-component system chemotaxis response regulator CheY
LRNLFFLYPLAIAKDGDRLKIVQSAPWVEVDLSRSKDMSKQRILIIDDDSSLRCLNAQILRDHGFYVETAPSGQSALSCLKTDKPPDLIFVDLIMPGMDGIEFLEALQCTSQFKDIPVILMTANDHPDLLLEIRSAKLAGLLIKPVVASKLIERVETFFAKQTKQVA